MQDEWLTDAIEHLNEKLYTIKHLLRLYAQWTVHEARSPVTVQSETFSVTMTSIADQVEAAIHYAESIPLRQR